MALMAALTAAGAYIAVPLGPVPFTLQPFVVLLTGLVLGWRLGALSMIVYIVIGLVAPVYHGGTSGIAILLGPTGGYLWGFVPAVVVIGLVVERTRPRRLWSLCAACVTGLVPIYVLGAGWLAWQLHTTSLHVVLWGGVLQFLPFDLTKALLAAVVCRALAAARLRLPGLTPPVHRGTEI
jgi:biotin transport system substrate-specific component